jgi:hypothetical protein
MWKGCACRDSYFTSFRGRLRCLVRGSSREKVKVGRVVLIELGLSVAGVRRVEERRVVSTYALCQVLGSGTECLHSLVS